MIACNRAVKRDMLKDLTKSVPAGIAPPVLAGEEAAVFCAALVTVVVSSLVTGAIVVGEVTVRAERVVPKVVNAGRVVGASETVVPPISVVTTETEPISDAGIALPSPVAVYWGGIESVAVLGFADGSAAYILPDSPPSFVYWPLSKFACDPPWTKSPVVSDP